MTPREHLEPFCEGGAGVSEGLPRAAPRSLSVLANGRLQGSPEEDHSTLRFISNHNEPQLRVGRLSPMARGESLPEPGPSAPPMQLGKELAMGRGHPKSFISSQLF